MGDRARRLTAGLRALALGAGAGALAAGAPAPSPGAALSSGAALTPGAAVSSGAGLSAGAPSSGLAPSTRLALWARAAPSSASGLAPPPGLPPRVVVLAGEVGGSQTLRDATVLVAGRVRLQPGARLTLQSSTLVGVGAPAVLGVGPSARLELDEVRSPGMGGGLEPGLGGGLELEVEPEGLLAARGLTASSVRLLVSGEATLSSARLEAPPSDLSTDAAVQVGAGGRLQAEGLSVTAPGRALRSAGEVELQASALAGSVAAELGGGSATLSSADLEGSSAGLVASEARVVLSAVRASGPQGAVRLEQSVLSARDVLLDSSQGAGYALQASGGEVEMTGASVSGDCGAYLVSGAAGRLEAVRFEVRGHAVTLGGAGPVEVRDSLLSGRDYGLGAYHSGPVLLEGNVLTAAIGVQVWGGTVSGSANRIESPTALAIEEEAAVGLTDGSVTGGGTPVVINRGSQPADLRRNWWGSASGPRPGALWGPVLADPWLSEPPGSA